MQSDVQVHEMFKLEMETYFWGFGIGSLRAQHQKSSKSLQLWQN